MSISCENIKFIFVSPAEKIQYWSMKTVLIKLKYFGKEPNAML